MKRRQFIAALGGAAALPLTARAQQTKVTRIGFLRYASPHEKQFNAFRDGLRALGWIEGQNIVIEQRYASGALNRHARGDIISSRTLEQSGAALAASWEIPYATRRKSSPHCLVTKEGTTWKGSHHQFQKARQVYRKRYSKPSNCISKADWIKQNTSTKQSWRHNQTISMPNICLGFFGLSKVEVRKRSNTSAQL